MCAIPSWTLIGATLCCVAMAACALQPGVFEKHTIDGNFAGGYQVSVADIDRDGKQDVIALSTTPSQLAWYKNPAWDKRSITAETENNIDVAPFDIDGDGDLDLALAYDFNLQDPAKGSVAWLECPANPASASEWPLHPIATVPSSHRVRWATWADRGATRRWLLDLPIVGLGAKAPTYAGDVSFVAFSVPSESEITKPWPPVTLDAHMQLAHGLSIVQWDGDPGVEILTASAGGIDLFDFGPSATLPEKKNLYTGHAGAMPAMGSSEVALGSLASQYMKFVASIEPWHGNEVVVYEVGTLRTMESGRTVIDDTLKDGHALLCLDIDKDGNYEIIAGGRGGDRAIRVYQFAAGNAAWERTLIDKGNIGATGFFAADINRDGYTDIVTIGTPTHNVVWYENKSGA